MQHLIEAIIALFIITDPFSSIPAFLSLTAKMTNQERTNAAMTASFVAGGVLVGFTLLGPALLSILGIQLRSFQIAGGILLLLMGVQFSFGLHFEREETKKKKMEAAVVLIGVPLICGPGAMTTALLLSGSFGVPTVLLAAISATVIAYFILRLANPIHSIIGPRGLDITSRLIGILLAAIAVEFILAGLGI
ncbi:hypothetical protein AUJ17_01670 [Candidatus Micrarchaeota archaeon CG1_02_47_40]|nr:MAG: hypothetical protein AUJ17_01670 [Candidatus Micrarchaeota archaeon CG1_02_47_40]